MEAVFAIAYFSLIVVYFFFENIFSVSYKKKESSMSLVNSSNNPTARLRKDPSVKVWLVKDKKGKTYWAEIEKRGDRNTITKYFSEGEIILDIIGEDNPKSFIPDIIGDDYEKEKSNDVPSFVDTNSEEWKKAKAELKEIQRSI